MSKIGATADSWKHEAMSDYREQIPYTDVFNESDMEIISQGYIPEEMEEKWFIYMEEDWLYLHRSWTGFCYYMVRFEKGGDEYHVAEALVNRDEKQKKPGCLAYEACTLKSIIHLLLLGRYVPIPKNEGQSDTDYALGLWSLVGNAMIPDGYFEKK